MGELQSWLPLVPPGAGQPSVLSTSRRQPKHLSVGLSEQRFDWGERKDECKKNLP